MLYQMKISFADHATQTYEYPSQQSLLDLMPAEPGDFDHPDTIANTVSTPSDEEIPDMDMPKPLLKSTAGIGAGGIICVLFLFTKIINVINGMLCVQQ